MAYRVEVVRSGEWWAITVPSLRGVFSQARHLDDVPAAAREAIAMMLDVDPAELGPIDVHVQEQGEAGSLLQRLPGFSRFGTGLTARRSRFSTREICVEPGRQMPFGIDLERELARHAVDATVPLASHSTAAGTARDPLVVGGAGRGVAVISRAGPG